MRNLAIVAALAATSAAYAESPSWATKDLRAGIIGTDTSHVPAFTALFRSRPEWKVRVVAAFKGGSPDLPISANRVDGFANTIHDKYGVELVASLDKLLPMVDVVLLESVDGRPHLAQATPVFKAGKRLFIDKPLAASLEDARDRAAVEGDWHPFLQLLFDAVSPGYSAAADQSGRRESYQGPGQFAFQQAGTPSRPLLLWCPRR